MTFTPVSTTSPGMAAGFGGLIGALIGGGLFGGNGFGFGGGGNAAGAIAQGVTNEVLLQGQANIRNDIPNQTIQLQSEIFNSRATASSEAASNTQYLSNQIGANDKAMVSTLLTNGFENRLGVQAVGNEINNNVMQGFNQTQAQNAAGFCQTQNQMQTGFNFLVIQGMQAKYDALVATNGIQSQLNDCCCGINLNMERGFSAVQLRDAYNKADIDKQFTEIKCLITDTAKDQTIREQAGIIFGMSQKNQTREITDAIKLGNCRTGNALNQIGWNEQIINPACKWPPAFFGYCA